MQHRGVPRIPRSCIYLKVVKYAEGRSRPRETSNESVRFIRSRGLGSFGGNQTGQSALAIFQALTAQDPPLLDAAPFVVPVFLATHPVNALLIFHDRD